MYYVHNVDVIWYVNCSRCDKAGYNIPPKGMIQTESSSLSPQSFVVGICRMYPSCVPQHDISSWPRNFNTTCCTFNCVQCANAWKETSVTVEGVSILSNAVHWWNVCIWISSSPSFNTTFLSRLHDANAPSPTSIKVKGSSTTSSDTIHKTKMHAFRCFAGPHWTLHS